MFNPMNELGFMSSLSGFYIPRTLRSSTIDEALNKPDVKLEELLDNEDMLFELKNCNPKLMDYLTKSKENIRKLLEYIIIMPPDPEDTKRCQKYPFLACEIFEADIAPILNAFFLNSSTTNTQFDSPKTSVIEGHDETKPVLSPEETKSLTTNESTGSPQIENSSNPNASTKNSSSASNTSTSVNLLEYFFSFVDNEEPLNPVLCGYFNKLIQALFKRNPRKLIEFVFERKNLLLKISKHCDQRSIAEIIVTFICYENIHYDEKNIGYLETKLKVIDYLLEVFPKTEDIEQMSNVSYIVSEIIYRGDIIMDGRELTQKIISVDTLKKLFPKLESGNNWIVSNIGFAIYAIISAYNPFPNGKKFDSFLPGANQLNDEEQLEKDPIINVISEHIPLMAKALEEELETSFGSHVKPLGSGKLKIVEIIERIIRFDCKKIYKKILEDNLIGSVLDLFQEFMWNNLLHTTVTKLITNILEKSEPILNEALFEKAKVLDIIIDSSQEEYIQLPKSSRKVRKGYLGHLNKIANDIIRCSNIEEDVKRFCKSPEWQNYTNTLLKKTNEANSTEIGGYNPRTLLGLNVNSMPSESSFGAFSGEIESTSNTNGKVGEIATTSVNYQTSISTSFQSPLVINPQLAVNNSISQGRDSPDKSSVDDFRKNEELSRPLSTPSPTITNNPLKQSFDSLTLPKLKSSELGIGDKVEKEIDVSGFKDGIKAEGDKEGLRFEDKSLIKKTSIEQKEISGSPNLTISVERVRIDSKDERKVGLKSPSKLNKSPSSSDGTKDGIEPTGRESPSPTKVVKKEPTKVVITQGQGLKFHIEPFVDSTSEAKPQNEEETKKEESETQAKTEEDVSVEEDLLDTKKRRSIPGSISNSMYLERHGSSDELNVNPLRNSMMSTSTNNSSRKFKLHLKVKKGQHVQAANISKILEAQLKKSGTDANADNSSITNTETNLKTSSYIKLKPNLEENKDKTETNKGQGIIGFEGKNGGAAEGQALPKITAEI